MAAGLATVSTDVGGIPEIVDESTGRCVPGGEVVALADAIAWMIDNPAEARAMGERGRCRVAEEFGVDTMVRRYQSIYDGVVDASGR